MGTLLQGICTVAVCIALALAGLYLTRRFLPGAVTQEHHDTANFIGTTLSAAYAVLLAFAVVIVWQQFDEAEQNVQEEANELTSMYRFAQGLQSPAGQQVQQLLNEYAHIVIEDEWPAMARGQPSDRAWDKISELWKAVTAVTQSPGDRDSPLADKLLDSMHHLDDLRTLRLFAAESSLPPALWIVLIVGGVVVIAYTYLFSSRRFATQAIMTAALTAMVAGSVYTISVIERPFAGDVHVNADAFVFVLELFRKLGVT